MKLNHYYLRFLEGYIDRVSEKIGYNLDSNRLIRMSRQAILTAEILSPVPIVVSAYLHYIIILLLSLGFLSFVHLLPLAYAYSRSKEYDLVVNKATIYIAMSAYVLTLTGKDLLTALRTMAQKGDKVSQVESQVVETKMRLFGKSLTDAVKDRLNSLKGTYLSELYSLYLTTKELGLSIASRLESFMRDLINEIEAKEESRVSLLTELNEVVLIIFLMFPIMAIGFSFLGTTNYSLLMIPLLTAPGLYLMISENTIAPQVKLSLSWYEKALVAVFFLLSALIVLLKLNFSLVIILFGLLVALPIHTRHYAVAERIFMLQPALLSALGDQLKLGYNVRESWERVVSYLERVDKSVRRIASPEGAKEMPFVSDTWRLAQIAYEGSYYAIYDEISRVANKLVSIYKTYQRKVRPLLALALLAPAFLLYTVHTFLSISSGVSGYELSLLIGLNLFALTALYSKAVKGTPFYFPLYLLIGLESLILSVLWL